jgi:hypothetical protein
VISQRLSDELNVNVVGRAHPPRWLRIPLVAGSSPARATALGRGDKDCPVLVNLKPLVALEYFFVVALGELARPLGMFNGEGTWPTATRSQTRGTSRNASAKRSTTCVEQSTVEDAVR